MRRLLVAVLAALVLAGCSTTAADLPLPGNGVRGGSYRLVAEFDDALNLAQGAPVKSGGVSIGRVSSISVRDFTARVTMDIRKDERLPQGSTARLRSTTPLGELFVQIDRPRTAAAGTLRAGSVLGRDATSVAPTIEDTMSAASMLVNGGGLGQLETIVREANEALGGREPVVRSALTRIASTVEALNAGQDDLDDALTALARVSRTLDERQDVVDAALREVRPAAAVLRRNTDELVRLLRGIDDLGDVVVRTIRASGADLESMLREVGPILEQLNTVGSRFRPGLQTVIGFARLIDRAVPAAFLNTYLYFQTEVSLGLPNLPIVGDLGLPRLDTPKLPGSGGALPSVPVPSATPSAPDLGLGGLLGGRR
ncbi:MAG: MCE family protein [Aeromicrobium erythreum]